MLRVCKTSQQLETEILIVPGHIHPSHRNSLLQYFERPCCEVFTMNRIYTTIFSSELGSAPAQQPGRNSGCCYRSQTVNSFALSSLQSIRLYTREEVAGLRILDTGLPLLYVTFVVGCGRFGVNVFCSGQGIK